MSVTYRNLPEELDPIPLMFCEENFSVPQSRFTPELTARLYERAVASIDMKSLLNVSDDIKHGLESLPSLLRYEPGPYGKKWLILTADKEVIAAALPKHTPYQLQYLDLFGFKLPKWEDVPLVAAKDERCSIHFQVMGEIEATTVLYSKKRRLYLVTARWTPEGEYNSNGKEPRFYDGPSLVFRLSQLSLEPTTWQDERIMARIADGRWADTAAFLANLQLVLNGSAEAIECRARSLRQVSKLLDFDNMPIYYGR